MTESDSTRSYIVSGMSCDHCKAAVTAELEDVPGVTGVVVDLASKRVTVTGADLHDDALRAAIDEAGYEAVPA